MQAGGRRFDPAWLHQLSRRVFAPASFRLNESDAIVLRTRGGLLFNNSGNVVKALHELTVHALYVGMLLIPAPYSSSDLAPRFFVMARRASSTRGSAHECVTERAQMLNAASAKKIKRGDRLRLYGQAIKRIRWMPWRQQAMKDVVACDKPRGAGKQALIRGFPNGETHPS